jgi:hypothetical protein
MCRTHQPKTRRPTEREKSLLGGGGGGLLKTVRAAELLAEAFDAAGGVNEFLFAREKRMTRRAYIDADFRQRAARDERVAAGAVNGARLIFRMNLGFHEKNSLADRASPHWRRRQPAFFTSGEFYQPQEAKTSRLAAAASRRVVLEPKSPRGRGG